MLAHKLQSAAELTPKRQRSRQCLAKVMAFHVMEFSAKEAQEAASTTASPTPTRSSLATIYSNKFASDLRSRPLQQGRSRPASSRPRAARGSGDGIEGEGDGRGRLEEAGFTSVNNTPS